MSSSDCRRLEFDTFIYNAFEHQYTMIQIAAGEGFDHEVCGNIEIVGFVSVSDEIEVNEVEKDGERYLDVVCSVQGDYVEFIDDEGSEHKEPLEQFYDHVGLN